MKKPAVARRGSLARVFALFAGSNLVATGLKSLGGFLTAKLVSPATLGLFNGIGVVQNYVPLVQLGVTQALTRELPYHLGRGDRERAHRLAAVSQHVIGRLALLVTAIVLLPAVVTLLQGRVEVAAGWATHALVCAAVTVQLHLLALYRTSDDFQRLAWINLLNGALNLALLGAVWWLDYYGLALRALGIWAVTIGIMWWFRPIRVVSRPDRADLRLLVRVGFPILLTSQMVMVWIAVHRSVVVAWLGREAFGLYSVGMLVETALLQLVGGFQHLNLPRVASRYAETHRLTDVLRITVKPTVLVALLTSGCAAVGWVLLPPAVTWFLPEYVEGIPAAQWSLLSAVAMSAWPFMNAFTATRRQLPHGMAVLAGVLAWGLALLLLSAARGGSPDLVAFPQALVVGRLVYGAVGVGILGLMALAERRTA